MISENEFNQLVQAVDQQKGELLYLQALMVAMMRSMPKEMQQLVYQNFLTAAEATRRAALFSEASEDVISAFDHYVEALGKPPKPAGS